MRFMRAHGQTPGPGQRPRTAGALAGAGAGALALPLLEMSGAGASLSTSLQLPKPLVLVLYVAVAALAGAVYGAVFQRAASDRRGGWLFGISYGFLLWMLGPVALLQTLVGHPLATGVPAMGILGVNLLSGLGLGLCFRPAQALVRTALGSRNGFSVLASLAGTDGGEKIGFPHTTRESR
jgi:peptidoglycan/LPS O-acetylase OafA/YrhL